MYNPGLFVLFLMDCEIVITILQLLEEINLSTYFLPHQFARGSENETMTNKNLTRHIPTELSASFEDCCWTWTTWSFGLDSSSWRSLCLFISN